MPYLVPQGCNECECCVQFMSYSYRDNSAYGDATCPVNQCCGASISGNIYSEEYDQACFDLLTPRATIYAGSVIDNIGSVAGLTFVQESNLLSYLKETTDVVPSVDTGARRLYLPFNVSNVDPCGPYGLLIVNVKWWFN